MKALNLPLRVSWVKFFLKQISKFDRGVLQIKKNALNFNCLFKGVEPYVQGRACNPGTICQSRDFGIGKRQSRDPGINPGIGIK
jgi:hypothetical protein